jgi:hypothetical protein
MSWSMYVKGSERRSGGKVREWVRGMEGKSSGGGWRGI